VVFSKGHRGVPVSGHISLLDHNGYQMADNSFIYPRTSSKNTFTFMWHCETAVPYNSGGVNWDPYGQVVGMPYAWTHNNGMGKYGNTGNQVYIGWNTAQFLTLYNRTSQQNYNVTVMPGTTLVGSPQYEWDIDITYNFANVAGVIWSNLGDGKSVATALDDMSRLIYGEKFVENSVLKDWLIVWGNQGLGLPT